MRLSTLVALLLLIAADLSAQETGTLTKAERVFTDIPTVEEVVGDELGDLKPDYSREALLSAVWSDPYFGEDVPRAPRTFNPFQFSVFGTTFRFMPFLAAANPTSTSAVPFGVVDPFAGAPVSTAYTPRTFRDRWWEWRMKRKLKEEPKAED